MIHNVYLLATEPGNPCRDVIHSRDADLKIRVFCLDNEDFHPDTSEIQLYGYANNQLFAFETVGISSDDAIDIVEAIQWYSNYIEFPDMEILPEDPRLDKNIAM
jgi:hypothetical protein